MSRIFPLVLIFTGGMVAFFFSIYQAIHSDWPDWVITSGFLLGAISMLSGCVGTFLRYSKLDHAERQKCLDTAPEVA